MKNKETDPQIAELKEQFNALKEEYTKDVLWYREELDKQWKWNLATLAIGVIVLITFGMGVVLTVTLWGLVSF